MLNGSLWLRGFRPFFAGACLHAIVAMALWLGVYLYGHPLQATGISIFQWHAHEMIYGYSMAVIAGFLLTAAWNWTGLKTASGASLAWIFLPWVAARVLMLGGTGQLAWAAAADLLFMLGLLLAVSRPIVKTRQVRQVPVLLIIALLMAGNAIYYAGAAGWTGVDPDIGIYSGLYLVLGMVLFMGRRVIPFFTSRGVGYDIELKNSRWNDWATIVVYPAFMVSEVLLPGHRSGALLAGVLFVLNSIRVHGWYTLGIWQKPLLWSLFASFVMINLGFLMRMLAAVTAVDGLLPIHAYAVGGIGIVTLSMMVRVTLGHTGRNVHQAPPITTILLGGMGLTALIRVLMPLMDPLHHRLWIAISGVTWILSFLVFAVLFIPMLVSKRADGK
jgi:uncharacterized protein involved in response to NO